MDRANKKINDRLMTNVTIERWLVVKFYEEDTVEAVPECWYNRQSKESYWPPKSFTGKQQTDYIKHSKRPESNWQRYPAAVLGSYDSLAVAIRKADKAKSTSDLSSACDEFPSSNYVRPSKKRKRPPLSDVESLSDTSSIRSDVDDDAYPDVTKLFSETDCRKRVQKSSKETEARRTLSSNEMAQGPQNSRNSVQPPPKEPRSKKNRSPLEKIRSPENYRKRFQLSPIDTKSAKRTRQSQEKSPSPQDYRKRFQSPPRLNKAGGNRSNDLENVGTKNQRLTVQSTSEKVKASTSKTPEFQVRLFKEIDSIQLKLNDLMDDVAILLKNRRLETERQMIPNDVPEIMHQFPLDEKSLYAVESWLNSKAEHKKILALELSHIGGSTAKEVTRRIMYRVFTNKVGSLYSWEGAKKKKPFKKLAISSTILNAVRLCKKTAESNEAEVIGHIKAWLVRCEDRLKNTSMKVKDNEVVAVPERKSDEDEISADGRSQARREYNYEDGAWEKSQGDKNKEKSREEIERQDQTTGNSKETQVGEENRDLEKGTKPHNCAKGIFGVSMRSEERGSNLFKNYSDDERDIATDKYGEQD